MIYFKYIWIIVLILKTKKHFTLDPYGTAATQILNKDQIQYKYKMVHCSFKYM